MRVTRVAAPPSRAAAAKTSPCAVKASLRAKEPAFRVDLVAAQFNGGGHACAAGLNLKTGAENFYSRLVAALAQRLAAVDAEKKG